MENHHEGIIIPHDNLTEEALHGLIEEFVTREAQIPDILMAVLKKMSKW